MTTCSVVIASYNYGRFLPQTLESVLAQTRQPDEIVVVDDGSTDDTKTMLAPYIESGQIKYVYQENAGVAAAKQRAAEESSGDLLAFLDADDLWEKTKLEKQLPLFKDEKIGGVFSKRFIIDENGVRSSFVHPPFFRGNILNDIFAYNFIAFSSAVVRRTAFDQAGGYDKTLFMGVDYDLWIRIAALYEFDYIDEPLICYRRGHANLSVNTSKRLSCTVQIMNKVLQDKGINSKLSTKAIRTAWSSVFCAYGVLRKSEGHTAQAFLMFCKSIYYYPFMKKTWNQIAWLLFPDSLLRFTKRILHRA